MTDPLFAADYLSALAALPALVPPLADAASFLGGLAAKGLSLLWVALGLGFVIFFHELGHFAVAKWCGVKVERFSIGFGPVVLSKTRGGTEYALSAFPLGGYVKMLGQDDIDPSQLTSDEIAEDPGSYSAKPVWQRMAIISAGVVMNLLTAVLFFAVALGLGLGAWPATVGRVTTGGPAWTAGVQTGDRLERVGGRPVETFSDVALATALSWGDTLRLEGTRADGAPLDVTLDPDDTGTRRTAGLGPGQGLTLDSYAPGDPAVVDPGTSAAGLADLLKPGDTLIAARVLPAEPDADEPAGEEPAREEPARADDDGADAVPLESFADYLAVVGAAADRPIAFTVRRDPEDPAGGEPEEFAVTVGPTAVRTFGLRVSAQPIAAVRAGSPAEAAGLQPGDQLLSVDGRKVDQELDPLRLPNLFFERADEPVTVEVVRTGGGGGPTVVPLTITPEPRPGWVSRPMSGSEPLDVPAIGAAFPLNPIVTAVTPGGPAAAAGVKANDKILAARFTPPKADGGEEAPEALEIPFVNEEEPRWNPWAYVFTLAQERPRDRVELVIERDGKKRTVKIDPAPAADWHFPLRGLRLPVEQVERKSDSAAAALADGLAETRTSVEQMYLTLASLATGRLSIKNLRGPPGIISEGMRFAENGVATFLAFLGFLSVNLAVLNFLPIPVLDGGHMVWLLWEAVTRKKPSENLVIAATWVGLGLIVLLMCTVIYLDVFVHHVFGGG